jgi:hypothetical protein
MPGGSALVVSAQFDPFTFDSQPSGDKFEISGAESFAEKFVPGAEISSHQDEAEAIGRCPKAIAQNLQTRRESEEFFRSALLKSGGDSKVLISSSLKTFILGARLLLCSAGVSPSRRGQENNEWLRVRAKRPDRSQFS